MAAVAKVPQEIEIADGVRVRQVKSMVADVRAKGEPVKDDSAAG